ncbi:MAG TPA: VWA domain-containing protein [Clostridia bacterium]|nr:VWA domain-containing protein [Clostridia bacterium]
MTRKKITTSLVFLLTITMIFTTSIGAYAESDIEFLPEESKTSNPAMSLELEREETSYKLGEAIEYGIRIKNTGDVVLSELLLEDKLAGEEVIDTLNIGQELLFERTYIIPLDNDKEFIENEVTLSIDVGETRLEAKDSFEAYMERMSSLEFVPDDTNEGQSEEDELEEEQPEEEGLNEEETDAEGLTEADSDSKDASKEEEPAEEDNNEDELAGKPSITNWAPIGLMGLRNSTQFTDTIDVSKTAIRTQDEDGNFIACRTFEITLGITGTPPAKPVDVVLVIDTSTSMNTGGRMQATRAAATSFADVVLGSGNPNNNRISIVNYGTNANHRLNWTNNLTTVTTNISNLGPSGTQYTNIHQGFIYAGERISGTGVSGARSEATKVVVMMSDGGANRYMGYSRPWPWSQPVYTTLSSTTYPTSHTDATIAAYQQGQALQNIANVFTVGLFTGMPLNEKNIAIDTLTKAAQAGQFYDSPNTNDLDAIYGKIASLVNYSAKDAVVVDKIGDNFNLVESSLPAGATYNASTREITWTPGTIGTNEQLKYLVQAKPEFLGGWADTNEYATLTYTDVNDEKGKTKGFPKPQVNVPAKLAVSLTDATITLGDSIKLGTGTAGETGENYMSPITGGDGNGNYTYEWRIDGDTTIISGDKNPTVSPTEDTKYELTVTDSNGCIAIATMWVRVTEPKVDVTIKKFITGNFGDLTRSFDFTLKVDKDDPIEFALSHNGSELIQGLPADAVLTLTEENGEYDVTVKVDGDIIPETNGSYTITLTGEDITITVTNNYDVPIDTGVPMDSLPYIIIIGMVVAGLGIMMIRRRRAGNQY